MGYLFHFATTISFLDGKKLRKDRDILRTFPNIQETNCFGEKSRIGTVFATILYKKIWR